MSANVETMFYVRENPWHGLGTKVNEAPGSREALIIAGLNWNVLQEPIYTETEEFIEGYKANVRDSDRKVLGVVTDRYKVIQNQEAFAFTDALLGEGVRYETAGSLQGEKESGSWHICHTNILFQGNGYPLIWCLLIPMTAQGQSRQHLPLSGWYARIP